MRTLSLVFFSVHYILCIFLHIHISHALIFFPFSLSLSTSHSHTELSFFSCLCSRVCLAITFLIQLLYRFISLSHLPSFSTSDPRNVKPVTTSIFSPSISRLFQMAVVIIFVFFTLR